MTSEPNSKSGQMPDQASRNKDGGSSTDSTRPKSPASSFPVGDPARRDFGDRTDDELKTMNPTHGDDTDHDAKRGRSDDQSRDHADEGHKGPRSEAKTSPSDDRAQNDRSNLGQHRNDKSKPMHGDGKSGSQGGASEKSSGSKPGRTQGGGSGR